MLWPHAGHATLSSVRDARVGWITEAQELNSGMMGENTPHWWLSDASNKNTTIPAKREVAAYSLSNNNELEK